MGSKEIKCLPDPYLICPGLVSGGREESAEQAFGPTRK